MKKLITLVLIAGIIIITANPAAAKTVTYDETELNHILSEAGMPEDLINELDFETKKFFITNSGEDLIFGGMSTQAFTRDAETEELKPIPLNNYGGIGPQAILSSDLELVIYHFDVNYSGTWMTDIYTQFEWKRNPKISPDGIYKDHIALSVPDGWEIQSGRYACATQVYDYSLSKGWHWTAPDSEGCGDNGNPTEYDGLYGVAWEFLRTGVPGFKYKGTAKLTMKKVQSNAIQRVISTYNEASSNLLGQYEVTISWGPASVTFTPIRGSADQGQIDYTW